MKLKFTHLILCLMSLLWACESKIDIPNLPTPNPVPEVAERTVFVYLLADNSLSQFARTDLNEMLEGVKEVDTRKNNLIVYMDRRGGDSHLLRICRNSNEEIVTDTVQTYENLRNSVGVNEMEEVFTYMVDHFPAQSFGLVLWSHGDGWIPYQNVNSRWIGQDTNQGKVDNRLNIDELHTVLKAVPHLDFVLFDACYMQSIEVAYELRDCADYFIGSPTEIPGPGAPYQRVVPALFASSAPEIAIASAYYTYYERNYKAGAGISNTNWTGGVSISVIQSDQLELLAERTKELFLYSKPVVNSPSSLCYDSLREGNYYDMGQFVKEAVADVTDYQAWKVAYDAAVIYGKTTPMNYNTGFRAEWKMVSMTSFTGVSTSIPNFYKRYQGYYKELSWYKATN